MAKQLPLKIRMDDAATLENFYAREAVRPMLSSLATVLEQGASGLYLWGSEGVGKSHVLQGACQAYAGDALYLPLGDLIEYPAAEVLEGCDGVSLIAIDNLDVMTRRPDWQEALFHLFNRRRDAGLPQLFAAQSAPVNYGEWLPDLRSRLASLPVFQLPRLEEDELAAVLRFRASLRGLTLSDEVIYYLLNRSPRSTLPLMSLLDALDEAALARGRAITIPLINELRVLSGGQ